MEVTGRIIVIKEENIINDKFKKREFVIETPEEYPQSLLIEFVNDKCRLLDNFKIGTEVTVKINLRGRKWINPEGIDKYFNTLQAWQMFESIAGTETNGTEGIPNQILNEEIGTDSEEDDLPF